MEATMYTRVTAIEEGMSQEAGGTTRDVHSIKGVSKDKHFAGEAGCDAAGPNAKFAVSPMAEVGARR